MELTTRERDLFGAYLEGCAGLAGDRRTRTLLGETVRGLSGSARRCGRRIAACSPGAGGDAARRAAGAADGPR